MATYGRGAPNLILTRGTWQRATAGGPGQIQTKGRLMFKNLSEKQELFIPDVDVSVRLLSKGPTESLSVHTEVGATGTPSPSHLF